MSQNSPVKTIDDLARLLGLSKSTVSRALNNNPLIAEETRRRVAEAARVHRFTKNVFAQRLSTNASRTVAFVTHSSADPCSSSDLFSLEMQGGISQGLSDLGYGLLVVPVDFRDPEWARRLLDSRQVDGFVLMTSSRKAGYLKTLLKSKAPFATWGSVTSPASYPTVCADDYRGGSLVAAHLVTLAGPIGVIAGPPDETEAQNRLAGFEAVLAEAQRPLDRALLRHGDYSEASGQACMNDLLDAGQPLRSVFCHSDLMAIGALKALRARGVRVPEDVALVGFDDLMLASYVEPRLTTISQHIHEAGRALAQVLVRYLETGQVSHVVMPVELIQRGTA